MAVLTLTPLRLPNNMCLVQLGVVKNRGSKSFSERVLIRNEGTPIPNLGLPLIFPSCDWAFITVKVLGCTSPAPTGQFLHPLIGFGGTFPTTVPVPVPPPVIYLPYVPVPGLNVVLDVTTMSSCSPLPGLPGTPTPGTIDCMSMAGATYELLITVTPLPGVTGLKTWEFRLAPQGERVVVCAALVDPNTPDSD